MFKNGIRVFINRYVDFLGLGVVIAKVEGDKVFVAKPVELVFEEVIKYDSYKPTLNIPYPISEEFLKAFAECLDERGVKTENDFKIQGILEAKKEHLDDMRKLVFKNKL